MDRGAWWAAVHGVAKSQTQLSDFTSSTSSVKLEKNIFNFYLKKNVYSTNELKISVRCHYSSSAAAAAAKSLQSCPTLCDPMDGSPPGSPVPGILQARTLEWVAISFSSA